MITQVVEVADDGRYLSKYRGFLKVEAKGSELGRVPLDDITCLILSGHQISLSKNLLVALAERKTPIITCGSNWHPLSLTLPYGNHFDQAGILWAQIECSSPLQKRLWQAIVKQKVANQRITLERLRGPSDKSKELSILERRIKSGDPDNIEAQAARHYWPALMGTDFRRDRLQQGTNSYLNYGYSILRAATARAVCGAGLTPALGLHHRNRKNPFALVDDLMEPWRPLVDETVFNLLQEDADISSPLTPEMKRHLTKVLDIDVQTEKGVTSLMNALHQLAQSLVTSLQQKTPDLSMAALKPAGNLL